MIKHGPTHNCCHIDPPYTCTHAIKTPNFCRVVLQSLFLLENTAGTLSRAPSSTMTFAHYLLAVRLEASNSNVKPLLLNSSSLSATPSSSGSSAFSLNFKPRKLAVFPKFFRVGQRAKAQVSDAGSAADPISHFKHLLLPITDRNPYLSEGTRHAAATAAALAKKYGADITVVVIDEKEKESIPEHDTQLSSIRWHLSEGGFQEFKLLERLGGGNKPTAIIGEIADEMSLDLVVMSMEAIHSKLVDANLLAEFIPCPVILLPL